MKLRTNRLPIIFDIAIVLLYAIFLWAPWERTAAAGAVNLAWLALPVALSRHGFLLAYATTIITICALAAAALGALLAIAARMRGTSALWAAGAWLFGCSVAILMPLWTAIGFLGALLMVLAVRARFVAMRRVPALVALLSELWPLGYAAGIAALAWRYNSQVLLKALVIALGVSLIARACVPSTSTATY